MEERKSQLVRTRQENYKGGKTKKKQTWTLIRLDSAERSNEMPKKLRGHLPFSPYRAPWISLIFCRASGSEKILLCYCQILKNYIYYLTWLVISHELLGQLLRFFFFLYLGDFLQLGTDLDQFLLAVLQPGLEPLILMQGLCVHLKKRAKRRLRTRAFIPEILLFSRARTW